MIRDGRDVAVSLRKRWFSPGYDIDTQAWFWQTNVTEARRQGRHCRHYTEVRYEDLINDTEQTIRQICSFIELDFHSNMLLYHEHTPHRLREHLARVRIDGSVIVSQEERFAQQAATTLPPDASRIGQWKIQLTTEDIHRFETVAGDTLRDCGYELYAK